MSEYESVHRYDQRALAKAAGVTRFVVKHYIVSGLLPNADGAGPHRAYTDRHLHILLAIAKLRSQGIRHKALAARMGAATMDEVRALAGVQPEPVPVVAPPPQPALPPPLAKRSPASLRHAVHTVIAAAADALDVSPKRARPAIAAAIAAMRDAEVTLDEAAAVLAVDAQP
jgi:DNA-binding transcriptional MerR regulator